MNEITKIKLKLLHQMNDFIINIGDELILDTWLACGIPDEPDEEDFLFFAENPEEWNDICELFGKLAKRSGVRSF